MIKIGAVVLVGADLYREFDIEFAGKKKFIALAIVEYETIASIRIVHRVVL